MLVCAYLASGIMCVTTVMLLTFWGKHGSELKRYHSCCFARATDAVGIHEFSNHDNSCGGRVKFQTPDQKRHDGRRQSAHVVDLGIW